MKIVFLDRETVGNVDTKVFESYGEYIEYDKTNFDEYKNRIKDTEVVITNKFVFNKESLDIANNLKLILLTATGYNNVDIEYANSKGIIVCNVEDYSTESVAECTFAHILNFYYKINKFNDYTSSGDWSKSGNFTYLGFNINELKDKTIGVVGYGNIGKRVEEIAKAFKMKVLISKIPGRNYSDNSRIDFDKLITKCDIISFHCPLTDLTRHMLNATNIENVKKGTLIINTSRGPVVEEEAIIKGIEQNILVGACLDVLKEEPPKLESKLLKMDNVIITPHIAWASEESRKFLIKKVEDNLKKYLSNNLIGLS